MHVIIIQFVYNIEYPFRLCIANVKVTVGHNIFRIGSKTFLGYLVNISKKRIRMYPGKNKKRANRVIKKKMIRNQGTLTINLDQITQ